MSVQLHIDFTHRRVTFDVDSTPDALAVIQRFEEGCEGRPYLRFQHERGEAIINRSQISGVSFDKEV